MTTVNLGSSNTLTVRGKTTIQGFYINFLVNSTLPPYVNTDIDLRLPNVQITLYDKSGNTTTIMQDSLMRLALESAMYENDMAAFFMTKGQLGISLDAAGTQTVIKIYLSTGLINLDKDDRVECSLNAPLATGVANVANTSSFQILPKYGNGLMNGIDIIKIKTLDSGQESWSENYGDNVNHLAFVETTVGGSNANPQDDQIISQLALKVDGNNRNFDVSNLYVGYTEQNDSVVLFPTGAAQLQASYLGANCLSMINRFRKRPAMGVEANFNFNGALVLPSACYIMARFNKTNDYIKNMVMTKQADHDVENVMNYGLTAKQMAR